MEFKLLLSLEREEVEGAMNRTRDVEGVCFKVGSATARGKEEGENEGVKNGVLGFRHFFGVE